MVVKLMTVVPILFAFLGEHFVDEMLGRALRAALSFLLTRLRAPVKALAIAALAGAPQRRLFHPATQKRQPSGTDSTRHSIISIELLYEPSFMLSIIENNY